MYVDRVCIDVPMCASIVVVLGHIDLLVGTIDCVLGQDGGSSFVRGLYSSSNSI